jgi:uncharacterized protein
MGLKRKHGHEMSIDEIVRSIRGIINTHNKDKGIDDEDILELTEILEDNQGKTNEDKEQEDLISPEIASNIKNKLKDFAETIEEARVNSVKYSGTTAEELLIQLLLPELKLWLDKNLPEIIDRTLTKELRRLTSQKK